MKQIFKGFTKTERKQRKNKGGLYKVFFSFFAKATEHEIPRTSTGFTKTADRDGARGGERFKTAKTQVPLQNKSFGSQYKGYINDFEP